MKKSKVVASKNLPARLPIWHTATVWLLLDRAHAAQWIWGAVGALMLVVWIVSIIGVSLQEEKEVFPEFDYTDLRGRK